MRGKGQTSFTANYGYNYTAALLNFDGSIYADIKRVENKKLAIPNEPQKVVCIWLGRNPTVNRSTSSHLSRSASWSIWSLR